MGKGAFRGSLHFCGQARQSARTRSKRPFPASRRRGSGDRPPHFPAGRQAEGGPAFVRSSAFGPADTRIGIRLPSPAAGQTDTRFIRQTRAPGFRQTGTPPFLIRQQPVPAAGEPPDPADPADPADRNTAAHPDSPTTRTAASAAYTRRRTRIGTAVSGAGHAKNPLRRTPHEGPGCPKKGGNRAYIFVSICRSNS